MMREVAGEAVMAGVIVVLVLSTVAFGFFIGVFIRLSFAIRWEDRRKGSLQFGAPDASTKAARTLVGIYQSGLGVTAGHPPVDGDSR